MRIDAHQHVGSLSSALSRRGALVPAEVDDSVDADHRLRALDSLGFDRAILQPSHGYLRPDGLAATARVNERMARYANFAPERFCAFGTVEPMYGSAAVDEVSRIADLGLRGIAWHHRFQGCFIDMPFMWPILERMSDFALVPIIHVAPDSSLEAPWRLQRLALDFPHLTFLAMDGLLGYERAQHIHNTAGLTPNVVWDMGGPISYISAGEWVKKNGSDTLCMSGNYQYGTGGTQTESAIVESFAMRQVEFLGLEDRDRDNIMGDNLARALNLSPAGTN